MHTKGAPTFVCGSETPITQLSSLWEIANMTSAADAIQTLAPTNVWPGDVTAFLALVDEVRHVDEVPTLASHLDQGKLTLVLGQAWEQAPHVARVEMLRHEASHVAHGCWARIGEREPRLWNLATDAVIHALRECDWELVDRECGIESVTLERLGTQLKRKLALMPSERIYELLEDHVQGQGCGSGQHSKHSSDILSRITATQVGSAVLGGTSGGGYRGDPPLAAVPEWIAQVLDWLVTRVVAREDRVRAWRRAHRTQPDLLPGSARGEARAARFMLDASGSMGDELLGQLLAAVCSTPELAGSDVVVFDHVCREPVDAADVGAVLAQVRTAGGGTLIRAAGVARDPDKQTVWLTDGGTADGWPDGAERDLWVVGYGEQHPQGASVVFRA